MFRIALLRGFAASQIYLKLGRYKSMEVMKILIYYTLFLLGLSGCSSIYHPKDSHVPEGYVDIQTAHNKFAISFESYQEESWEELESYLSRRANEIGLGNGFSFYSGSVIERKERLELITVPAVVVPEAMGNCGDCTYTGSGALIPEYQREFHIRAVSGSFTYDTEVEGKKLIKVIGRSL